MALLGEAACWVKRCLAKPTEVPKRALIRCKESRGGDGGVMPGLFAVLSFEVVATMHEWHPPAGLRRWPQCLTLPGLASPASGQQAMHSATRQNNPTHSLTRSVGTLFAAVQVLLAKAHSRQGRLGTELVSQQPGGMADEKSGTGVPSRSLSGSGQRSRRVTPPRISVRNHHLLQGAGGKEVCSPTDGMMSPITAAISKRRGQFKACVASSSSLHWRQGTLVLAEGAARHWPQALRAPLCCNEAAAVRNLTVSALTHLPRACSDTKSPLRRMDRI